LYRPAAVMDRDLAAPPASGLAAGGGSMTEPSDAVNAQTCPWCSASASTDATQCPACGAALAQRESIGDLVIPGVTSVDPGLQAYAARPLHISGPSPSQGMAAGGVAAAAALGGPIGLAAALGGLAAVAAVEYQGAASRSGGPVVKPDAVGRPSEAALLALERLGQVPEPDAAPESKPHDETPDTAT
jgi:hypothetical protein